MIYSSAGFTTSVLKRSEENDPGALHIIIPHCVNWRLTEACVNAFARMTSMKFSITIVNNFDEVPSRLSILGQPNVTLINHQLTLFGKFVRSFYRKRNGSIENALALDTAIKEQPKFTWGFMTHSDSAPLIKGWERFFFSGMGSGKIIGNYRDTIRIHAAHASGTLFRQDAIVEGGTSMKPEYQGANQKLDVGDRATEVLHDASKGFVPVLPNTINDKNLIVQIESAFSLLASLAKDGSAISLDASASFPVFAHLGRGTPRSLNDPHFSHKLPQDIWIDYLNSI